MPHLRIQAMREGSFMAVDVNVSASHNVEKYNVRRRLNPLSKKRRIYMKLFKKKIAFVLLVAVLTLCLAAPALAATKSLAKNSTWSSTVTSNLASLMASGTGYVSLNFGNKFEESFVGAVAITYPTSASRWVYALTAQYSATLTY